MAQFLVGNISYNVSDEATAKYPELVQLILHTESMDRVDKQYWLDILPSMTESHVNRLHDILETERRKLLELESRYQQEMQNLNERHMVEWHQFQYQKNKKRLETAQAQSEQEDKQSADDILTTLV
jgi:hypothetical protein